jgi:SAM-dependent methyltransferase
MSGESVGESYYQENYSDYERQNSTRKLEFYMRLVRAWVPRNSRLHELGVGLGYFLAYASPEYSCTGSDVNGYAVTEARRRAPRAVVSDGSFEAIPKDPKPVVVVAWDVLEHIPALPGALDCIRERLTESGFLIGVVPVYDGPLGWLVYRLDHDPTHIWKWSRHEWMEVLRRHGFEVLQ